MKKESLRGELLARLNSLTNEEVLSLCFQLTTQLIKFFTLAPELSRQIGGAYLPFKTEVAPAYQELLKAVPLNLAYPVLQEEVMFFGIPDGMPKGKTWLEPPYHLVEPSWLLVPGVGFDLGGARLGRGRGFYDRFLEGKTMLKIGLAWSEQIKDKIPVEQHDCHMDFIITEKFCWNVSEQMKF